MNDSFSGDLSFDERCHEFEDQLLQLEQAQDDKAQHSLIAEYAYFLYLHDAFEKSFILFRRYFQQKKNIEKKYGKLLTKQAQFYEAYISLLEQNGEIDELRDTFTDYLRYFLRRKNASRALAVIEQYKDGPFNKEILLLWEMTFKVIQNDFASVEKNIGNIFSIDDEYLPAVTSWSEHYIDNFECSILLRSLFVKSLLPTYRSDIKCVGPSEAAKGKTSIQILKLLLESFLLDPKNPETALLCARYFLIGNSSLKSRAFAIHTSLVKERLKDEKLKEAIEKELIEIDEQLSELEKNGSSSDQNIMDTFQEVSESKDATIAKLERDINFLKNKGDIKALEFAYAELKNKDPDNTLLDLLSAHLKEQDQQKTETKSISIKSALRNDLLVQGLLDEISSLTGKAYSDQNQVRDFSFYEVDYCKLIEMEDAEKLALSLKDLIAAFNVYGLYKVAHTLLDKVSSWYIRSGGPSEEQKIEMDYLKIVTFMNQNEYYEALNILAQIGQRDICFSYLKAECFYFLKKKKEALELYKGISRVDMNYRLVKERMRELEEG